MFQKFGRLFENFLSRAMLLVSFVMVASLVTQASDHMIQELMKNEIGPAFKIVTTDVRAKKITDETKKAAQTLIESFTKLQSENPELVPDFDNGGMRRATEEDVKEFHTRNTNMIQLSQSLSTALQAGDLKESLRIMTEMNQGRLDGHDRFKKPIP